MWKKIRHDGPPISCDGWKWTWEAFQGKAFPNFYNGDINADQTESDCDRELWIRKRDSLDAVERERVTRHMAKRRREKTGGRR